MADSTPIQVAGRVAQVAVVDPPDQAAGAASLSPGAQAARQLQQQAQQLSAQKQQLQRALAALEAALGQTQQLQQQIQEQAEAQLLDLAIEIASKVLVQQVQADRYEMAPIVRAALEHLPPRTAVTVHLNPKDLEQIQSAADGQLGRHVRLAADPTIKPAECLVQAEQGSITSSVSDGLSAVAAAMKGQG